MGYYNDDYFKGFEDRSSSRRRGEDRAGRQNTSPINNYRYPDGRDPYARKPRDDHRYNFDDGSYDLGNFGAESYRRNVYASANARREPRADVRYPIKKTHKRRLPRRVRRTLIVAGFLTVLIAMISLIIAIAVATSSVGTVDDLKASDVTAQDIVLKWERARNAEGYRVMISSGGDYTEYEKLNDGFIQTVTVSGLEQATAYSFQVIALSGEKAGDPAELTNVCTLPQAPSVTNIFSAKQGSFHVDWSQNDKASGYVVEYRKAGDSYSSDSIRTISDPTQCRTDITGLDVNTEYLVRVYAYLSAEQQINGDPSAEVSVTVVAQDTEVAPKAMDQQADPAIDPNKPMIALTFDDGPAAEGDSSDRILDVLEQNGAKATFFMVGVNVDANQANVKRKASLGMELGNHTWNHYNYGESVTPEDIRKASNKIYEVTGQFPTCFRSPGGMTTTTILNECAAENMAAYYWSIDTEDWNSRDADAVYHSVMDHVQDGDIILMHEIYGSTADAVARMVPELIAQGYQLVTCHDLIALKGGSEPVPGTQYVDATSTMDP